MLIAKAAENSDGSLLLVGWLLLLFVWGIVFRISKLLAFALLPIFVVLLIVYTIQIQNNS